MTRSEMITLGAALCAAAVAAGGCASVPENISTPIPGPDIREARGDPDAHAGARVRWGGTISDVSNLKDRTVVTVVARPVTGRGEPLGDEPAVGRFLAVVERFLEPEEYRAGRRITTVGRFTGIESSKIDQHVYDYPVVQVENLYLWREYAERGPRYHDPYPYWHYPYYPWHRHYLHGFSRHPWYW